MAYTANVYQGNHIAATDLQNIEDNFEYLRTNFSGAGAPADPGGGLEGMMWWDSSAGANPSTTGVLKIRDDAGWRAVFTGSAAFKIWAYLDTAENGWARDSNMKDQVLALKSDAGDYVTGATYDKGSWTISGLNIGNESSHTHSHNHDLLRGTEEHNVGDVASATKAYTDNSTGDEEPLVYRSAGPSADEVWPIRTRTDTDASTGSAHSHFATHIPGWRIRASVGIMVYPDM